MEILAIPMRPLASAVPPTEAEISVLHIIRALGLDQAEAIRRLSAPATRTDGWRHRARTMRLAPPAS
jgi:hypothetical protein